MLPKLAYRENHFFIISFDGHLLKSTERQESERFILVTNHTKHSKLHLMHHFLFVDQVSGFVDQSH